MAKKIFWKNRMASEDVGSLLVSGRFYNGSNKTAEIHDGALVVIGNLEPHAYYEGVTDLNVRKITAPAEDTDRVAVVDIVNRSEGTIHDVTYREGIKTTDMTQGAGYLVRVRILAPYDSFTIGAGNIIGEPAKGKYLIPTAGSTLFTVSDSEVAGKTCFYIEAKNPLIEGVIDTDDKYLCTVLPRKNA